MLGMCEVLGAPSPEERVEQGGKKRKEEKREEEKRRGKRRKKEKDEKTKVQKLKIVCFRLFLSLGRDFIFVVV